MRETSIDRIEITNVWSNLGPSSTTNWDLLIVADIDHVVCPVQGEYLNSCYCCGRKSTYTGSELQWISRSKWSYGTEGLT